MLNSLKSLSLSGDSWPNYVRLEWEAGDEGIRCPPTTHFIATLDDVTDMLDFDSDDTDGMDVGAGDDLEPPPTGRWTATSSYDIYMVDTPKEDDSAKRTQWRIKPPDKSQNDGADAALSPATVKIAITALERSTPQSTQKATTTIWTQRCSRTSQVTPNTARSRRPITAILRAELINLPLEKSTVRTTMHSSSRKTFGMR